MTTQIEPLESHASVRGDEKRSRWPLAASAAGLLGFTATLVLDGRGAGTDISLSDKLFTDLSPMTYRLSMITGYLAVAMLLLMAAQWRRRVEPRVPGSTAASWRRSGWWRRPPASPTATAGRVRSGSTCPDGPEAGSFDSSGLYVYYMLCDFGAWIGWLGVVITAAAPSPGWGCGSARCPAGSGS